MTPPSPTCGPRYVERPCLDQQWPGARVARAAARPQRGGLIHRHGQGAVDRLRGRPGHDHVLRRQRRRRGCCWPAMTADPAGPTPPPHAGAPRPGCRSPARWHPRSGGTARCRCGWGTSPTSRSVHAGAAHRARRAGRRSSPSGSPHPAPFGPGLAGRGPDRPIVACQASHRCLRSQPRTAAAAHQYVLPTSNSHGSVRRRTFSASAASIDRQGTGRMMLCCSASGLASLIKPGSASSSRAGEVVGADQRVQHHLVQPQAAQDAPDPMPRLGGSGRGGGSAALGQAAGIGHSRARGPLPRPRRRPPRQADDRHRRRQRPSPATSKPSGRSRPPPPPLRRVPSSRSSRDLHTGRRRLGVVVDDAARHSRTVVISAISRTARSAT